MGEVSIYCWRPPYCAEVQSSITCLLAHPTLVGGAVSSQVEGLDRAQLTYLLVKDNFFCLLAPSGALIRNSHPDLLVIQHHHHHPTFSEHTGPQHWTFTF